MRILTILLIGFALFGCQNTNSTSAANENKASASPAAANHEQSPDPMKETPATTASPSSMEPKPAPTVEATDQDGNPVSFSELYKKGTVLVYFYPKADTPGCTAQACSLRDAYEELTDRGVTVVGVSLDSTQDQAKFREKYNLPFTLIADEDKKVVDAFGVSHKGSFASREAFLIKDGKIVWHDASASTADQAKDVMAQLTTED